MCQFHQAAQRQATCILMNCQWHFSFFLFHFSFCIFFITVQHFYVEKLYKTQNSHIFCLNVTWNNKETVVHYKKKNNQPKKPPKNKTKPTNQPTNKPNQKPKQTSRLIKSLFLANTCFPRTELQEELFFQRIENISKNFPQKIHCSIIKTWLQTLCNFSFLSPLKFHLDFSQISPRLKKLRHAPISRGW